MTRYDELIAMPSPAPPHWAEPCTHQECSLHQLSPYIGKLKRSIAQDLILRYSKPGELVADMFCGSGTVPLETARLGRCVFASDVSIYAMALTQRKLQAPMTSETALAELEDLVREGT
jgi:methylase of polypeptide subunit release factors